MSEPEEGPEEPEGKTPEAPSLLRAVARGSAYLLGTAVAVRLAELVVGRSPLGAALAGAVIVDLLTYRVGVRWDKPSDEADKPSAKSLNRRRLRSIGLGALAAVALVCVPLAVSVVVGAAKVSLGAPSASLAFGLLRAAAVGARDELLYRGLPLAVAASAGISAPIAIAYGALAGVTPLLFAQGASWEALVLVVSQGVLYGVLWSRTSSAWASVSAHATWMLFAGLGLRGGLLDVAWQSGVLTDGPRARGLPALLGAATALALAVLLWKKLRDNPAESSQRSTA